MKTDLNRLIFKFPFYLGIGINLKHISKGLTKLHNSYTVEYCTAIKHSFYNNF